MFVIVVVVIVSFVSLVLFEQKVGSDFQSKLKETLHITGSFRNSFRFLIQILNLKNPKSESNSECAVVS